MYLWKIYSWEFSRSQAPFATLKALARSKYITSVYKLIFFNFNKNINYYDNWYFSIARGFYRA